MISIVVLLFSLAACFCLWLSGFSFEWFYWPSHASGSSRFCIHVEGAFWLAPSLAAIAFFALRRFLEVLPCLTNTK